MTQPATVDALLTAITPLIAFDGWGDVAFADAAAACDLTPDQARTICPRGAVDLAIAYHQRGDSAMIAAMHTADLSQMRYRDKVAHAIRLRLDAVDDKEIARRGTTLFSLPHMAPDGAKLLWGTADAIWSALGDTSEDVNWYSKRATLSAVYGSVVLFWLGDTSENDTDTDAFIDRRIGDVMQFEKLKASVNGASLAKPFLAPLHAVMSRIKAPQPVATRTDLPGIWHDPK